MSSSSKSAMIRLGAPKGASNSRFTCHVLAQQRIGQGRERLFVEAGDEFFRVGRGEDFVEENSQIGVGSLVETERRLPQFTNAPGEGGGMFAHRYA